MQRLRLAGVLFHLSQPQNRSFQFYQRERLRFLLKELDELKAAYMQFSDMEVSEGGRGLRRILFVKGAPNRQVGLQVQGINGDRPTQQGDPDRFGVQGVHPVGLLVDLAFQLFLGPRV